MRAERCCPDPTQWLREENKTEQIFAPQDATAMFTSSLGYRVPLVQDATAVFGSRSTLRLEFWKISAIEFNPCAVFASKFANFLAELEESVRVSCFAT